MDAADYSSNTAGTYHIIIKGFIMKTIMKYCSILLCTVMFIFAGSLYAQHGLTDKKIDVSREVQPHWVFEKADHVANGISLRHRSSGTIQLRGVPQRAKVVKALLFFNFISRELYQDSLFNVLFDGNRVVGVLVGISKEPCWEMNLKYSLSYFADVTDFILCRAHPNQDYSIVLSFNERTATFGDNPWISEHPEQERFLEGATLVIVYQTDESRAPVYIYDNLNDCMFSHSGKFILFHNQMLSQKAYFTLIGADGQRGKGHSNIVSNEKSFFNGNQIAGPQSPVVSTTSVDWDGSDGWPLIQLWDTHTHEVRVFGREAKVVYEAYREMKYFDCVVPVAFIIDVK